jgi:hypothetical protein
MRATTLQASPKDLRTLPAHPETAVSWHSGFGGGAHAQPQTARVIGSLGGAVAGWPVIAGAAVALTEQACNRDHHSGDPCGQTKNQQSVAEEKRHVSAFPKMGRAAPTRVQHVRIEGCVDAPPE